MPRIYNAISDPLDFCKECYPKTEAEAFRLYGQGEGPDNRGNCFGYDAEAPDYGELDYTCERCGRLLRSNDN